MTTTYKLAAGESFPEITVPRLGGEPLTLGRPLADGTDWQLVVVYRGQHCPLCTKYLGQLKDLVGDFRAAGVDVVVVSADTEAKARAQAQDEVGVGVPIGYDLSVAQMQQLGLYISHPRSPKETDRPFAEPGVFVVNAAGALQVVDVSNLPFVRPDLERLLAGLRWIRKPDNDYPIRGTYPYAA